MRIVDTDTAKDELKGFPPPIMQGEQTPMPDEGEEDDFEEESDEDFDDSEEDEESDEQDAEEDAPTKGDDTVDINEEYRTKAADWDKFADRYSQDPVTFNQLLYNALSDDQKKAFLAMTGAAPPEPEPPHPMEGYEPTSGMEEYLLKKMDVFDKVPTFEKHFEEMRGQSEIHRQYLHDAHSRLALAEARMEALTEFLGVTLPDADWEAIGKEIQAGKSYSDAVKQHYSPKAKEAIKTSRQANKPRPNTPGNGSGQNRSLRGASLSDVLNGRF